MIKYFDNSFILSENDYQNVNSLIKYLFNKTKLNLIEFKKKKKMHIIINHSNL